MSFRKSETVLVNCLDDKLREAKVTSVSKTDKNLIRVKFSDGTIQHCSIRNVQHKNGKVDKTNKSCTRSGKPGNIRRLVSSEMSEREIPERFVSLYKKLGKKKVDFGQHKDKNWTYRDLLANDENYCRITVGRNYNIPDSFKNYCTFMLL